MSRRTLTLAMLYASCIVAGVAVAIVAAMEGGAP